MKTILTLLLLLAFPAWAAPSSTVTIRKQNQAIKFNVTIAKTDEEKAQGLMHRTSLPENEGMLFLFAKPQVVRMWMKDTPLPLDMLFVNDAGHIVKIVKNATPNSLTTISSGVRVVAVLEINAMLSDKLSIREGDMLFYQ